MPDLLFRPWVPSDEPFLWEMLYQSLHVSEGSQPFPRSVLEQPEIAHYLTGFGSGDGDDAQVCLVGSGVLIGAAWCRRLPAEDPGYGFVAEDIPEIGMAVVGSWRSRGIGRRLLQDLLTRHPAMSLSVDDDNRGAAALYESLGFVPIGTDGTSTTMLRS